MSRPDPAHVVEDRTITKTIPKLGAKFQMQIAWASETMRHYETTNCKIEAHRTQWSTYIKNFEHQQKVLEGRKRKDYSIETPRVRKPLVIIKWSESMMEFFY